MSQVTETNNEAVGGDAGEQAAVLPEGKEKSIINRVTSLFRPELPADLSREDMRKQVFVIAGPSIAELFLMQLCSMVTTMMVGNLGNWAIAAVGYCTQPRFLLLAAFIALNSGSTALVARAKGAGDPALANRVMHQSLLLSLILSIILTVVGVVFAEPMVKFMGADTPESIKAATSYMKWQMISFPASALTMAVTAILRGLGKTKVSMYYNITANVVNVCVNLLLIYGAFGLPRLEIVGAGIAMATGQIVAFVMAVMVTLKGNEILHFSLREMFTFDFDVIKRMMNIGAPAMLEQLIMRGGMMIYALTVASLGQDVYATHTIALNILSISFMNGQAFGISATSLIGQSLGKKRPDLGKAYTYVCRKYGMYVSLVLAAMFLFCGKPLMMLYTKDPNVILSGAQVLMIVALLQPLQSSQLVLSGALRGAGDTRSVAVCTFFGILIMRPLVSLLLVKVVGLGLIGAWVALIADQSVRSGYTMIRFASDKWATIKV